MDTPPIVGDLTTLDPVNIQGDRDTLMDVQRRYNALLARNAEQQQEINRLRDEQQDAQMHHRLNGTLDRVGKQVASSAIAQTVTIHFAGKAKELPRFIEEIEKYTLLSTGGQADEDLSSAAYQFSRREASDFIKETLKRNPRIIWEDLTSLLKERFGEKLDPQTLLLKLRTYSQRPGQTIQVFAEVVLKKGTEIFEDDLTTSYAQRELVSIFAKGLKSKAIAKKVVGDLPRSLVDAVALAVKLEEKERRLTAHGLRGEPMDVNAVNQGSKGGKANPRKKDSDGWKDGKPICYRCGKLGHFLRECRMKPKVKDGAHGAPSKVNEVEEMEKE